MRYQETSLVIDKYPLLITVKNIKNNMDWKAFLYKSYPFGNSYGPYIHWLPQNLNDLLPIEADLEENGLNSDEILKLEFFSIL